MVDAATQRLNMVESQVLTSDVTDRRILRAMRELPRERFVPAPMAALAYMDEAVPLTPPRARSAAGCWRRACWRSCCNSPTSAMTTACSMSAAPPAIRRPCWPAWRKTVVALESDIKLAEQARTNLAALGLDNVERGRRRVDRRLGRQGPLRCDRAARRGVPPVPETLFDQLKDGGRLVAILSRGRLGQSNDLAPARTLGRRMGRHLTPRHRCCPDSSAHRYLCFSLCASARRARLRDFVLFAGSSGRLARRDCVGVPRVGVGLRQRQHKGFPPTLPRHYTNQHPFPRLNGDLRFISWARGKPARVWLGEVMRTAIPKTASTTMGSPLG